MRTDVFALSGGDNLSVVKNRVAAQHRPANQASELRSDVRAQLVPILQSLAGQRISGSQIDEHEIRVHPDLDAAFISDAKTSRRIRRREPRHVLDRQATLMTTGLQQNSESRL